MVLRKSTTIPLLSKATLAVSGSMPWVLMKSEITTTRPLFPAKTSPANTILSPKADGVAKGIVLLNASIAAPLGAF